MNGHKSIAVSLKDEDVATPHLKLKQWGFESLNEYVKGIVSGKISTPQLIDELATLIADKITSRLLVKELPLSVNALNCEASQRVILVARGRFELPSPAPKAGIQGF